MKKSLVSGLIGALAVGVTATAFAAANPFEDVPADHWAYDAVAQLAADGVIEGYGDGTYRGDQEITRYEMAQMVARAMAKSGVSGADKAMIDRLAAEFADELNNLGVRVAALEKKVDNVKFHGLFRYTYSRGRTEGSSDHTNTNDFRLRLQTAMAINEHWTGKARVEYKSDMNSAENSTGANGKVFLNRAYVEGKYGSTTIDLGRFPAFTTVDGGMVLDDEVSGGQVVFGDKASLKLVAARYYDNYTGGAFPLSRGTASYQSIEVNSDPHQKFTIGAAYHHVANKAAMRSHTVDGPHKPYGADSMNIWTVGTGYRFDKNVALSGAYAKNTQGDVESKLRTAWSAELDYKGADPTDQGSWGAYLAYRHLGDYGIMFPTYNAIFTGQKGWQLGVRATVLKNVVATFEYFDGKDISTDLKQNTVFARVEAFF